jgi:UDP-N-acetylmuramoylalanine--D-glutamate ligase
LNYDIVILGSGESGTGAALLAHQQGLKTFVSDGGKIPTCYKDELVKANISFEEEGHDLEKILSAKEVVKSPGIPDSAPVMQEVKKNNIPVMSEIEFAYRYKGDSKIVAITGTNGKTTTATLTDHLFRKADYDVSLVGNVGFSFARQIATQPTAWYVMEISSFQLDDIKIFRPDVAVILNITADHLDRYDYKLDNYIQAKFKITTAQTNEDVLILNFDDQNIMNNTNYIKTNPKIQYISMEEQKSKSGAFISENEMVLSQDSERVTISKDKISLNGKHNQYNTMAACISARVAEVRAEKIRESLQSFQSLEHRMETVVSIRGVEFINDSKATNLNSVWYALESMHKKTVLILGGVDKGNDYSEIAELVQDKVKAIVALGTDTKAIQEHFRTMVPVIESTSMAEAVAASYELAVKGECVLLSPACASFDLFKNYEDRGDQFKIAVKNL